MSDAQSVRRAAAVMLGLVLVWGYAWIVAKMALAYCGPLDLATYKDEYREGLQQIIDAKIAGEEIVAPNVEAPPKVVNLMDALKKSLDAVSTGKKKPAKAAAAKAPAAQATKRKRA